MYKLGPVAVGGSNPIRIMGILNVSPESFYKKSIKTTKQEIAETAKKMEDEGADFIDVGGMSTAPYLSTTVSEKTESNRITEAIKVIQNKTNLPISVDTCRANVAVQALELGVPIINDITGLKFDRTMIDVVKNYQPSLVLCAFSKKIIRGNQVLKTRNLLKQSLDLAKSAGIPTKKIVLDPAIGFFRKSGKGSFFTKIDSDWLQRDLLILANLGSLGELQPLLVSVSNKSFIGKIMNKENSADRLPGTLSAEVVAALSDVAVIRTHDVKKTKQIVMLTRKH